LSLDLALRLAARGWHVLPCDPLEKRPLGQLVPNGHHDATTDSDVLRSWWARRPDARPGIALEASGLVAFDVDVKDPGWRDSYTAVEPHLAPTVQQATPSGGAHALYARTDPAQARRIVRWRPGIDLLGKGYVIAYQDLEGDPAPLPPILAGAFHGGEKTEKKPAQPSESDFEAASWELLQYAHRLAIAHGPKAKGEGGNQHAYALGALLLNDLALTEEEARPIVLAWRDAFPETQGWREDYLLETVAHAARYAEGERGGRRLELAVLEGLNVSPARLEYTPDRPFVEAGASPQAADGWYDRESAVALIRSRADEPWISVGVHGVQVEEVRAGGTVTLQGPTGAGKTSLVGEMLLHHTNAGGRAVVLSAELSADEFSARVVGIVRGTYWKAVLKGELTDAEMVQALPERFHVTDGQNATLAALEARLALLRGLVGQEEPFLAVVDYGQIIEAPGEGVRDRTAAVWKCLNDIGRRHRAVILVLSQMSRQSSKAARGGERLGVEAMDGGAESSAIERWSTLVLEIGAIEAEDEDGQRSVALSMAKGRMSGGDMVLPMLYEGRTGRWRVEGAARPAAEVKAEKAEQAASDKLRADVETLFEALKAAYERGVRLTKDAWVKEHVLTRERTKAALDALVTQGRLEVLVEFNALARRDVAVYVPAFVAPSAPAA
jgi:hypothetical protein